MRSDDGLKRNFDLLIGLILASLAVAWRLYAGLGKGPPTGDELIAAVTTFEILQTNGFVPFLVGQDYMGTVQEYMMAAFMMVLGVNELSLRLPPVVFSGAAVFLAYHTISKEISRIVALASSVLLVAGNSAIVSTQALPDNSATIFACVAIAWQTFRVDRSRTLVQWVMLGVLAGVGAYLHQISVLQTIGSLVFLTSRSVIWARLRSTVSAQTVFLLMSFALIAGILLSAVGYHFLTRRSSFVASPANSAALIGGLFFAGVFLIVLIRALKPSRYELASIASFVVPFVGFWGLPHLWFRYHQLPALMSDHVPLWSAGTYSLKHAHQWFTEQPGLFFNYVLPRILIGKSELFSGPGMLSGPVPIETLGWFSVVGASLLLAGLFLHFRTRNACFSLPECVFLLPLLLLILAFFPSWRLVGPGSYRYVVLFAPALYLAIVLAIRAIFASRAVLFSLVGAYVLYAAYDVFAQRQFVSPDKDCNSIAARLTELKADGVVVSGRCAQQLAWRAAGRYWVADADYRPGDHPTLYLRPSRVAAANSIAAVNLDEAALSRLLGVNPKTFSSVEVSPGLVIYRRRPSS